MNNLTDAADFKKMLDSEALFYEAAIELGGRPEAVYRKTALGVLMDNFAYIATPSLPPHVYWNYIGSPDVNAVAFVHKQNEFIGINIGTILMLHDLFLSLMAHRSFAPDIGAPPQTRGTLRGVTERLSFATRGGGLNKPRWLSERPEDPVRESYAWALSHCALDFILQHELAHLEMGHLEYLNCQKSSGQLLERRAQDGHLWEMDVSQACETDADRAAVGICLHRLRRLQALPSEAGSSASFLDILQQEQYSYRAWHTAVGMLFFLFGLDDAAMGANVERSHPHPHLRHLMASYVGLLDTRRDAPEFESAYQEGQGKVTDDMVGAWLEMAGRDFVADYVGTKADLQRVWSRLIPRTTAVWKDMEEAGRRRRSRIYRAG